MNDGVIPVGPVYEQPPEHDMALLDLAWGLIANAARLVDAVDGSWAVEAGEWMEAAGKWRTAWFDRMDESRRPRGAVIEIVERVAAGTSPDDMPPYVVPDEVRLNGAPLLAGAGGPVVERISMPHREPVLVTLRVYARRVVIAAEPR